MMSVGEQNSQTIMNPWSTVAKAKYSLLFDDIDKEMPELRDVPWYEKALNAVGGAGVAIVEDNLYGFIDIFWGINDLLHGTNCRENILKNLEEKEQWIVDNLVTYEEGYYFLKKQ